MNNSVKLPQEVQTAIEMLEQKGYEAYIVGGCVRDSLLNKSPKDYDITTSALPKQTEEVFDGYKIIETGLKHGTVTVLINGTPLEVTTFRVESQYSDNRHPDSVDFTSSLRDDVSRRDFTMNAIAYSQSKGMQDFFCGKEDINNKIIRCVGDADKRFKEDALRILRAIRFSSVLGFEIEENTKAAIFFNKELLKNISAERIASELVKLLCGKNVKEVLMSYINVLGTVIPEILPMKDFNQKNYHHIYDVWEHTAVAVESIPPEPTLRLAALFHDIGKPSCFSTDDKGVGHFYGHAGRGADMTDKILKRLRFDTYTRTTVVTLIKTHDDQIAPNRKGVRRALNRLTPDIFSLLILLKKADNAAQHPKYRYRQRECDELLKIGDEILTEDICYSLKSLAVNGNDIMELGIPKGTEIGRILNRLLDEVIKERLKNDKTVLINFAKEKLL